MNPQQQQASRLLADTWRAGLLAEKVFPPKIARSLVRELEWARTAPWFDGNLEHGLALAQEIRDEAARRGLTEEAAA